MFQLELEEFHHLDRRARGTGDCDTAVPVGREDLLERAVADQVARGSATVAGQEHAIGEADRNAGRAVAVVVGVERTVDRCGRDSARCEQPVEVGARIVLDAEQREIHEGYWPPFWI